MGRGSVGGVLISNNKFVIFNLTNMTPEELFKEITAVHKATLGGLTNKQAAIVAYNLAIQKAADIARGENDRHTAILIEQEIIPLK